MENKRLIMWVFLALIILTGCQSQITTLSQTVETQTTEIQSTEIQTTVQTTETQTTEIQTTTFTSFDTTIPSTHQPDTLLALEGISIDTNTINASYTIDEFSLEDMQVNLIFSDDSILEIGIREDMLMDGTPNITEPGVYTFNIEYLSYQTSLTVNIIDNHEITNIEIDTYNPYALIANFDISHINLIVSYSDGSQSLVPLSYDMLSSIDINKLFVEGLQDITVKYGDLTTTFIIAMFAEYPSVENNELSQNEAIFYEVMSMLENNHFSEPDTEALYLGAMNGMIESLEDPYTIYYSHEEFERRQDGLSESYVGIGIAIANIDNQLVITRVVSGGPAEKAGIQTNDIIRIIKGVEVTKDNIFDIVNTLFGELGETLNIKIERAGVEGLIEFQIDYEIIDVPTVESRTVMDGEDIISIIKVNSFGSETADIFENAVVTAEEENIQGMVIDLRNNGGGYLSAVVQMMQIFLIDDAKAILTFESYSNGFSINTFYGGQTEKKPYDIVVLVNENSASASEVFSLAMQEHGNYTVVGKQTYGKGVGQFSLPLSESVGDYLTITHAKWYGPDGTWVHRNGGTNGVVPDVIAEHNELESLWKIYLSNDEVIEYNTVDQRTERIQVILNGMGYNLRTDGYYDLQTQAAIEDIQTQNALTMTGNIDQMTIQIINQWLDDYQANIDTQLEKAIDQLNN